METSPSSSSSPPKGEQSQPHPSKKPAQNRKMPPPESSQSIRTRTLVLFSFWFVVIFIGIPVWHATTSIYRAPLPLCEMQSWADGRACKAEFPLLVDVEARSLADPDGLLKTAQHILDDANDFAMHRPHHLRLRLLGSEEKKSEVETETPSASVDNTQSSNEAVTDAAENVACVLRLLPAEQGDSTFNYSVHSTSRVVDVYYPAKSSLSSSSFLNNLASYVATTLQDIFWQEQQLIEHLLQPYSRVSTSTPSSSPCTTCTTSATGDAVAPVADKGSGNSNHGHVPKRMSEAEMSRRMSRVVRYAPTYHLAFSLFTATSSPSSWDVEEALTSYLSPLLAALSSISNFTISTQVQYYASFTPSVIPTWDENTNSWTLKKEELSSFINSAEWPLASISDSPTINFILYVPHPSVTPLRIPSSASNNEGFLIPQWGGVVILNPSGNAAEQNHLSTENLRSPLETFAAQLLALLGAPAHPASLPIRLDSLTRQRSAEVLVSASSTLGSLFQIVSNLTSISIPTAVQESVQDTLKHLTYGCEELSKGRFKQALEMGRVAQEEAEKAFFERTMVAQVYFPDEHKVAVYLPLLGPVGVPLVMALFREGKRWFSARRGRGVTAAT